MGLNWAEHTVEIEAPIETCFEAITDYETFPTWQGAVVDTEVLDWDSTGRGKRVRLFIDAKVRKVDYTLDYSYEAPTRIEWDFVEGNGIKGADGHYLFEDLGNDRTRATYKLGLEVGIPLPGPAHGWRRARGGRRGHGPGSRAGPRPVLIKIQPPATGSDRGRRRGKHQARRQAAASRFSRLRPLTPRRRSRRRSAGSPRSPVRIPGGRSFAVPRRSPASRRSSPRSGRRCGRRSRFPVPRR